MSASFSGRLLFLPFNTVKAEIVGYLYSKSVFSTSILGPNSCFKVSSYTVLMSLVCGLEVAKTGSLTVMGTANPYL